MDTMTKMSTNRFKHKWWALLGLCILAFTAFLDATIVDTALPFIKTDFQIEIVQLQWVANIFTIVLSTTMITVGRLADHFGPKKIFYLGTFCFTLAAIGAGISPSIHFLVGFRGLQALGTSIIFVTAAALISEVFPEHERLRAISIYTGITGFGLMAGPVIGGILIQVLGWRWIFWINLPLIAIGLAACSFNLRNYYHVQSDVKINWKNLLILTSSLGSFIYGIIIGAQAGWRSMLPVILVVLGIFMFILFMFYNKRQSIPFIDFSFFKHHLIKLTALSCSLAGIASTVFMFFDPLYLRIILKLTPFGIGLLIAIIPSAQVLISFAFIQIVRWFGIANLLLFSVFVGFFAIILHHWFSSQTSLIFLTIPFFLLGINWGLSNSAMIMAIKETVYVKKIATAIGSITTIWNIIGSIMLASSTAVFQAALKKGAFLLPFQQMIYFNILFAALLLISSIYYRILIKN